MGTPSGDALPNFDYPAIQATGLSLMSLLASIPAGTARPRIANRGFACAREVKRTACAYRISRHNDLAFVQECVATIAAVAPGPSDRQQETAHSAHRFQLGA